MTKSSVPRSSELSDRRLVPTWDRVFPWLFQHLSPDLRNLLRRAKFRILGHLSPKTYWNLASAISATAAICTDCVDEQRFFELAEREASLLRTLRLLGPQVRAIDIGCGIGRIEKAILHEVHSIVGVDISSRMVLTARQKVNADNVQFREVGGRSLDGITSNDFGLCFSFLVLQHIPRPFVRNYFREAFRVLKPGGRFFFQIPLSVGRESVDPPPDHPFGCRLYSLDEVRDLIESTGFTFLGRFNDAGLSPNLADEYDAHFEFFLAGK